MSFTEKPKNGKVTNEIESIHYEKKSTNDLLKKERKYEQILQVCEDFLKITCLLK